MATTFYFDFDDEGGSMFWAYTETVEDANAIACDLQSLGGSTLETDGAFVYCNVDDEAVPGILAELEEAGYDCEER